MSVAAAIAALVLVVLWRRAPVDATPLPRGDYIVTCRNGRRFGVSHDPARRGGFRVIDLRTGWLYICHSGVQHRASRAVQRFEAAEAAGRRLDGWHEGVRRALLLPHHAAKREKE